MGTPKRQVRSTFRVLALDGGGAKGFYTLGVLKEVEAMLGGGRLCEQFELIYGTSTGAIIAALLALGKSVDTIHGLYKSHVPTVMKPLSKSAKSRALARLAVTVFGDAKFTQLQTRLGIVAASWDFETPMIFKSDAAQAHGRPATFTPGFGCTIADAVQASCSAYPFFQRKTVTKANGDKVELIDGGYCANNPALYAIADAHTALRIKNEDLRLLSIGVGMYPEPPGVLRKLRRAIGNPALVSSASLLQKTLSINTLSMDRLLDAFCRDVQHVRINERFSQPDMATDFLEHDLDKLSMLHRRGSESFAAYEVQLKQLLGVE